MLKQYKYIFLLLICYLAVATFCIFYFDGTGDSGDSVLHYLYSRYSWEQPELLLNHWAKPLFTFITSPFAQFGFVGMKVFNVIVICSCILFTYLVSIQLKIKNSSISGIFIICMPLVFVLTFSGLTEPLFALFTILSVYFVLTNKRIVYGAIILSFLPFIRSEGLIMIGVFALFFIYIKNWKALFFLTFGHVIYSIIGSFYYADLFWVFNKIPYAKLSSTYGDGNIFHFVNQLLFVLGVPIYILFWSGILRSIINSFTKEISSRFIFLIVLPILAFIGAHSLFWYLGIFNSMGLNRVLICIVPLIAIVALYSLNSIFVFKTNWLKPRIVVSAILLLVLVFPFLNNNASIHWDKEMNRHADQIASNEVAEFLIKKKLTDRRMVYYHPNLSLDLNLNHFDTLQRINISQNYLKSPREGDVVVWDNWFAVVESGVSLDMLNQNTRFIELKTISFSKDGKNSNFVVFECIR